MKTAGMLIMTAIWHIKAETDQFQLNEALQTKSTASVVMQETSHPFPRRTRNELRMERPFMRWTASSREDDRMRVMRKMIMKSSDVTIICPGLSPSSGESSEMNSGLTLKSEFLND